MSKQIEVRTEKAPKAIGPYSQAISIGDLVFCSGQIAIDPVKGEMIEGGIEEQTRQVIENLSQILIAAGSGLEKVVKSEVYLKNINDFKVMNGVYEKYLNSDPCPARVTVEVSKLPKDALIEMSCVAYK